MKIVIQKQLAIKLVPNRLHSTATKLCLRCPDCRSTDMRRLFIVHIVAILSIINVVLGREKNYKVRENTRKGSQELKHAIPLKQKYILTDEHRNYFKESSVPAVYAPQFVKHPDIGLCRASDFIPTEVLGRGGFGIVFKAWNSKLGRGFAVKYLTPEILKEDLDQILKEEKMHYQLNHPNISTFFCSMKASDGGLLQVQQLCRGKTLRKVTKHSPQPFTRRRFDRIIEQLLNALMYLHNKGIVHRDIKPQNILIDVENHDKAMLIDFGLADYEKQGLISRAGTLSYFAPEIMVKTKHGYGRAVDLYALGMTLAVAYLREYPVRITEWGQLTDYHEKLNRKGSLIPQLDDKHIDSIVRILTKIDPGARWRAVYGKSRPPRLKLNKRLSRLFRQSRPNKVRPLKKKSERVGRAKAQERISSG